MGIRFKLITSLVSILTVLTLVLGSAFAVREQRKLIELKQQHLQHSAELAADFLAQLDATDTEKAVAALNISSSGGPSFQILWDGDHQTAPSNGADLGPNASEFMTVVVPVRRASGPTSARLIAAERMPDTQTLIVSNLAEHFALGAALTAAAALAIAFVCQRLVVRPVRWLVAAADTMAQGDDWDPIQPTTRRRDEIGVLGDHLAGLSRRLAAAVRSARHGSAHLVALRVRRQMEEPLRRLTVGVVTLDASADGEPDIKRELEQLHCQLRELSEISKSLAKIQPDPDFDVPIMRSATAKERSADTKSVSSAHADGDSPEGIAGT